jgi:hypothetical protein
MDLPKDIDIHLIAHDFVDWANDHNPDIDDPREGPNTLEEVIRTWLSDDWGPVANGDYPGVILQDDSKDIAGNEAEVADAVANLVDYHQAEFSFRKPWPQDAKT